MFTTRSQIQEALIRTGRCLALMGAGEFTFMVCGGSALNLFGLLERPTRDVDVLGMVKGTKHNVVVAERLPKEVTRAAEMVAADLNLPFDWLNDSALEVQRLGLPPGILKRSHKQKFGPCLTLLVIDRKDQVALKLYAAIDRQKGQRHFKDLVAINARRDEIEFAITWLLNRKTSPQFRNAIQSLVETLGFKYLWKAGDFKVARNVNRDTPKQQCYGKSKGGGQPQKKQSKKRTFNAQKMRV